ncbi:MAG TPA: hypothetical protein VGA04_14640 [Streptosporangiaceae bacterium]
MALRVVFTGRNPERVGEPTDTSESARIEWVPLASVPSLIASEQIWTGGSLVGLLYLLGQGTSSAGDGSPGHGR